MMTVQECIRYVEDHLEIRPATKNGAYTCGRKIKPSGCVNHSIGCAQPSADVIYRNMNNANAMWGVNALLGDFHKGEGRIIVTLRFDPETKKCSRNWGVGSGKKGSWNNSRIQWEVCEPAGHTYAGGTMIGYDVAKNQAYFDRMWRMLVAWNVYCIVKFGYSVNNINDHAESYRAGMGSNHGDMGHWIQKHGKSMDVLRAEVKAILDNQGIEGDDDMDVKRFKELYNEMRKELQDNDAAKWSEEARQWAVSTGLIQGGTPLPNGEPNYMWDDVLDRQQFVMLLYRFAKMMGEA